jgi:hypothetical protein
MAASTITRVTWTDGAAGTVVNNARKNSDFYDKVDQMFAGAGSYATFTFGGLVASEAFGDHSFSAGGTGYQTVVIANTTSGTGNGSRTQIIAGTTATHIRALSQAYTTSTYLTQAAGVFDSNGAGGISIAATNASGDIRFYAGGTTEVGRVVSTLWFINDTSNAFSNDGLTIKQATSASGGEALALKSGSVAHGVTSIAETDTYARFATIQDASGGLVIEGFSESTIGLYLAGVATTADTTKSAVAVAPVELVGYLKSGTTHGQMSANGNIVAMSDGAGVRHLFDMDGDYFYDGAAPANYDRWDDLALLRTLDLTFRGPDLIETEWDRFVTYNRDDLQRAGIVTDGGFVCLTKHTRLLNGATWQTFTQMKALEARVAALEAGR